MKESVEVNLVQLEITVWPKEPDSDACLGLTVDDFELLVDHNEQSIYALDSFGATAEAGESESIPSVAPPIGGLSIVLLFDLWHLDVFYKDFSACPRTKPIAFEEARRYVKEDFHYGDRLLLVTAAGWPIVHYGWIRSRDEALQALNRLEKNRQVVSPRQEHTHHGNWIAGIESLFLALGRYPGRKDVIYLGDDFRFDDVATRIYEFAARAQSSGVVVSSIDLVNACRGIPGPGCPGMRVGGLGCTDFDSPVVLGPLSGNTGGKLFRTDQLVLATRELRRMQKCRYVVSFQMDPRKRKRYPSITIRLREKRRDLTLLAPLSFQPAGREPSQVAKNEALFLLPQFGRGIAAEVAVWPYRPSGKRGRWKAFVLARVSRTDAEPWPDELTEIAINVLVHKSSKVYGEFKKTLTGDDLEALRTAGSTRLMLFPVLGVLPGETTATLTAVGNAEGISASVHELFDVPVPPESGEARPWFLSDHLVRFGDSLVQGPSLDDVVLPGEPISFMGYACGARPGAPPEPGPLAGRLLPFAGGAPVPVALTWLTGTDGRADGCGWVVGHVLVPIQPGLWTFEPPTTPGGTSLPSGVTFQVVGASDADALPMGHAQE